MGRQCEGEEGAREESWREKICGRRRVRRKKSVDTYFKAREEAKDEKGKDILRGEERRRRNDHREADKNHDKPYHFYRTIRVRTMRRTDEGIKENNKEEKGNG